MCPPWFFYGWTNSECPIHSCLVLWLNTYLKKKIFFKTLDDKDEGQKKTLSSGHDRTLTHTAAEATSTGSNQSTPQPAVGRVSQAPTSNVALSAVSESPVSLGAQTLVGYLCSIGWFHIQEASHRHPRSSNSTQQVIFLKNDIKFQACIREGGS